MKQKFECDQCGTCCSLLVEADWLDSQREPKLLTLQTWTPEQLEGLRNGDQCIVLWVEKGCPFLAKRDDGKCDCSIYPTRPNGCVSCEAGGPKCQFARIERGHPLLNDKDGNVPDTANWRSEYGDWYGVDFIDELVEQIAALES